jgi:two-component SAPR family response regulator
VTVRLLGGFRIHTHAENDEVGHGLRDETREFLALLAAHPRGVRTEEIPDHLRMTADPDQAARELGNMRRAVRRILRGATGARQAAFIVRTGDRTRLDPTLVATDVEAFTTAIHQAAAATTDTARAAALRTAVDTYAGPLCEGADYPWADALREALHRKAVDALVLLADHTATHHPEPDPALALLDHAPTTNPSTSASSASNSPPAATTPPAAPTTTSPAASPKSTPHPTRPPPPSSGRRPVGEGGGALGYAMARPVRRRGMRAPGT